MKNQITLSQMKIFSEATKDLSSGQKAREMKKLEWMSFKDDAEFSEYASELSGERAQVEGRPQRATEAELDDIMKVLGI